MENPKFDRDPYDSFMEPSTAKRNGLTAAMATPGGPLQKVELDAFLITLPIKERQHFFSILEKQQALIDVLKSTSNDLKEKTQNMSEAKDREPLLFDADLVYLAIGSLGQDYSDRENKFIAKYGEMKNRPRANELTRFALWGEISVELNGVSLQDFLPDRGKQKKLTAVDYFKFCYDAYQITASNDISEIIEENEQVNPLFVEFPDEGVHHVEKVRDRVISLFLQNENSISNRISLSKVPIEKEVTKRKEVFQNRVKWMQQEVIRSLFEPENTDFQHLKKIIENVSSGTMQDRNFLILSLGIHNSSDLKALFRKVQKAIDKGKEANTYSVIQLALEEILENFSGSGILGDDDFDAFYEKDTVDDSDSEFSYTDFNKTTSLIFSKSSQIEYNIAPEHIQWDGIVKPNQVKLFLNPQRISQMAVSLTYESDEEKEILWIYIDAKKDDFEWAFIADTSTRPYERYQTIKHLQRVLQDALRQAEEAWERRNIKTPVQAEVSSGKKRERYEDPMYALRKEARMGQEQNISFTQVVSESMQSEKIEVKNKVAGPENISEIRGYETLTDEEKKFLEDELVKLQVAGDHKITKYVPGKDIGEGKFKRKFGKRKGLRMILELTESDEKNIRVFSIVKVLPRRNDYRGERVV